MDETRHKLHGKLQVNTEFGIFLGDTRIRLLEAIDSCGSINQAAKKVPLSYKAAWDAIDVMNNLAEFPLVERSTGGRHGGGTLVTEYGKKVIALFRALEAEYQAALERVASQIGGDKASDTTSFRQLIKHMAVKSSARNQFAGTVTALRQGDVDVEVKIQIDPSTELISVITKDSAESLGLETGMSVSALVKSSSILVTTDPQIKASVGNCLWGEITRIADGTINTEVTIETPGGKSVCAVVTQASAEDLKLEIGKKACAVFKASSVILCRYA